MITNQLVFEVVRDFGHMLQNLKVGETVWLNVKRDCDVYFSFDASRFIPLGKSETSNAIEKAFKVTRGEPDARDLKIERLKKQVDVLTKLLEQLDIGFNPDGAEYVPLLEGGFYSTRLGSFIDWPGDITTDVKLKGDNDE